MQILKYARSKTWKSKLDSPEIILTGGKRTKGKLITIDVFGDGLEFVTEEGFWKSFDADTEIINIRTKNSSQNLSNS
jgi:hypothetical protein